MATRDRIAEPWGARTPYGRGERWPERVDSYLTDDLPPDSVDRWELLAQGAQAAKDERLLELAQCCHPETLRQMRWANAIKELAPQTLTS